MATHHLLSILITFTTTISTVSAAGFTIDLIHRDSPGSPLASNSTTSHVDKLYNSFQRSIIRARDITRASTNKLPTQALVYPAGAEYLVDLSLGTPPQRFLGIVDTGSDLTWTQCKPCVQCFVQDLPPIFDPTKSTSYKTLTCDSNACNALSPSTRGCAGNNPCAYLYNYGDKSYTIGELAAEALTFGPPTAWISSFAFGCGHQNQGNFETPATGILGLSQGPLSLPSQTMHIPDFGGKFAYCLVPYEGGFKEDVKSKMSFGDEAIVSGYNAASTPIVSGVSKEFYYITLQAVSVGVRTIWNGPGSGDENVGVGNMVIDSGTTLTFLPIEMFDDLVVELKTHIKAEMVGDPRATLKLCYLGEIEVPNISFHFPGATLGMGIKNTFVEVADNVSCLAMLPADKFAIFGNLAQRNFVVGHDLNAKTVSFKATYCKTYVP